MRRFFKAFLILIVFLIILNIGMTPIYGNNNNESITILFTHDMHDHFYPFSVASDKETKVLGGFARLYSAIEEEKNIDPEALVVDAGDCSMGTLFQTIFASHSPTLRLMGSMGYDVTTFGNHEFDFRAEGLADSLNAATNSGDVLPEIVASNTVFPYDENGNLTDSLLKLKDSMENYGVKDYLVLKRNGIKVGIFGLIGKDADSNAPMSEVLFEDMVESSKRIVDILKNEEKVDLIVALSHSGIEDKKSKSEDEILAKKVSDIDVIVSGHTHTTLVEPIVVGNTIIGSAGSYGENLGVLKISRTDKGRWKLDEYRLKEINGSLPLDQAISKTIDEFKEIVQSEYLDNFDMEFNQVLAYSPFDFTPSSLLGKEQKEDILGNLISDSYIYAVKKA
ncbi:MAG TPA: metallophosphatase [Tissierellaceae bacterium]|nr:metallophosphatase [Tissierellaceae bacterium]